MARRDDDEEPLDEEVDEAEEESKPKRSKPRAQVSALTLILCLLNALAAAGFLFLLSMDYAKRQAWSHAIFQHDLALMGLPIKEEEKGPSASQLTFPKPKLSADELKAAMTQRGVKGTESVLPAILDLPPIPPEHLTPAILKEWFQGAGEPVVKFLDEEIDRLKQDLPNKIAAEGQEVAAAVKTEADQRQKLEKILLRLAYSVHQVQAVAKKVKELPAAQLNDKLADAAERRLLVDILVPLDAQRPAESKDRMLEQVANIDTLDLKTLRNLLMRRIDALLADKFEPTLHFGSAWADQPRDTVDRRHAIAYFLFVLSQVKKANGESLYPAERVPVIVGLHQTALAAQEMSRALVGVHERILDAIKVDREGAVFPGKGGPDRTPGFVDYYGDELQRIRSLLSLLKTRQNRLADAKERIKGHEAAVADRAEQVKVVTKKIVAARAETAKQMQQLADLEKRFFQAKLQLRNAQAENLRLERQIGILEGVKQKERATP